MRQDSKHPAQAVKLRPVAAGARPDPRTWVPPLLGVLAVLNLAAAWFVWQTPGGSAGDLADQIADGQAQVQRSAANLGRLRALVKKVETARDEQQKFVARYFIDRRTQSSTILTELEQSASRAGLTPKEHSFNLEPIEGSDVFTMMTIAANYEGRYSDLRQFIGALDKSERFLIIEDVTAAPQQEPGKLSARFKINAFIREGFPALLTNPRNAATAAPKAEVRPETREDASLKLAEKR